MPLQQRNGENFAVGEQLMDPGHHMDDWPANLRRRRVTQSYGEVLPREAMLQHVLEKGLERPT